MRVPSASFYDTHSAKITDLMINLVEYIQTLDKQLNPSTEDRDGIGPEQRCGIGTGTGTGTRTATRPMGGSSLQLEKNSSGYPILPDPLLSEGWKKPAWDALYSDYLGQQYHLALGGNIRHIPYKRISEKQNDYIDPKYLPRKTTFRPPRNIPLKEIKSIFEFLLQRQRIHGPEDTFRFKSIKWKGDTVAARYKTLETTESDSPP